MNSLKTILMIFLILGTMVACGAQTRVVRVYPKQGTVVTTINRPKVVMHDRTNYYVADGVWYRARGRKYVVCAAPVGVRLQVLPKGYRVVRVNGRRLYKYRGVWYKKTGRNFVVVTA